MNRFSTKKKNKAWWRGLILPIGGFALMLGLFYWGIQSLDSTTDEERLASLEKSVNRAVIQCYAIEGAYPPNLAYLEENYGLVIDHETYVVQYVSFASNLKPEVLVTLKYFTEGETIPWDEVEE